MDHQIRAGRTAEAGGKILINYTDYSDYGQEVLQLAAEIAELMDPEKDYTKKEVVTRLNRVKNWAYILKRNVIAEPVDSSYWGP